MLLLRNKDQHQNNPQVSFATSLCNRAVEVEPEQEQFWMAGAGAKNFQMVEPEPEIWVPIPQRYFVGQATYTNNMMFFMLFWTKLFWIRSQKAPKITTPRAGAGS